MSTGLACALLIFLWAQDEWSVDGFNANDNNLFEVLIRAETADEVQIWDETPGPLADAMVESLPEVTSATSYHNSFMQPKGILLSGESSTEVVGLYAKSNFFEVFSYPLLQGISQAVLANKNNIVLTRSTATRLFGSVNNAINKVLEWKNEYFEEQFQVAGICDDPLPNATNQFGAVIHYSWIIDVDNFANEWSGGYAKTCVVLEYGSNIDQVNEKLTELYFSNRGKNFNKPRSLFLSKIF